MTKHKPLSNSPRVLTTPREVDICEVSHVGKVPTEVDLAYRSSRSGSSASAPETPRGLLCCRSRDGISELSSADIARRYQSAWLSAWLP